ncbi:MAG: hypothetical protein HJJLKODD_00942 [Phycisphaerae bacterium]|nr:hypothetical protein [Phycisphaerae bacterium]
MELPVVALPRPSSSVGVLPPLYARWMDEFLGQGLPTETKATCAQCAMCAYQDGQPILNDYTFDPAIKCCTYIPNLPNYLVGNILRDENPDMAAGQSSLRSRMEAGEGITPLGVSLSSMQQVVYSHVAMNRGFGRSKDVRCPHYVEGRCGIHRHRNAVCSTYYCKYDRGQIGLDFWSRVNVLLMHLERELSLWAAMQLLDDPKLLAVMARHDSMPILGGKAETRAPAGNWVNVWGKWWHEREAYYQQTAERVNGLSFAEVLTIGGATAQFRAQSMRRGYEEQMTERLPEQLTVRELKIRHFGPEDCFIESYSPTDPQAVPQPLLEVLPYFDGKRSVAEVIAVVDQEKDIVLDTGLIQKLVDFQILVQPAPAAGSGSTG